MLVDAPSAVRISTDETGKLSAVSCNVQRVTLLLGWTG